MTRLPNFLHLGPGKSGSSWLHETLALHPEVYLSEAKDLYFFSRYYDRGVDWYRKQFRPARPLAPRRRRGLPRLSRPAPRGHRGGSARASAPTSA